MSTIITRIITTISCDVTLKAFLTSAAAGIGQSGHKVTRQRRLFKLSQFALPADKVPNCYNLQTRSPVKAKVFVLSHCNALADPQSPSVLWDDNLVLKIAKILGNTS